jgi:hypothetical protein
MSCVDVHFEKNNFKFFGRTRQAGQERSTDGVARFCVRHNSLTRHIITQFSKIHNPLQNLLQDDKICRPMLRHYGSNSGNRHHSLSTTTVINSSHSKTS